MNKSNKYILSMAILVFLIIIVIIFISINSNKVLLEYTHDDSGVPGNKYEVKLKGNNDLYIKVISGCSTINCDNKTKEYNIKIDNNEKDKILKIIAKDNYDKKSLSTALSAIARNDEVMAKKDNYSTTWDITYKDDDKNNDGIVTYREFGDNFLDIIINQ